MQDLVRKISGPQDESSVEPLLTRKWLVANGPNAYLSSDGSQVAYYAYPGKQDVDGPGYEIYVAPTDGSGAAISGQVVLTSADAPVWEPAWSPDGTRIGYSRVVGGDAHIFVANADGSGSTDITPNMDSSRPTWTGR